MSEVRQPAASKPYYYGLDLMRGLAALFVVLYHLASRIDLGGLFYHSYLAVDFFFILSGFVIDQAYGDRLASSELSFGRFIRIRAIRLLPLVAAGTILAAIVDLGRPGPSSFSGHVVDILESALLGIFCLPTFWPTTMEQSLFPLNGPTWSILFELIANFVAVPIYRLKNRGAVFCWIALISLIILVWRSNLSHSVDFGSRREGFVWGLPRVLWSFFLGIMISRVRLRVPPISIWAYAILLTCILLCPKFPDVFDQLLDLGAIGLLLPIVVAGTASCVPIPHLAWLARRCGELSYPLYSIHYALVRVAGTFIRQHHLPVVFGAAVTIMIVTALSAAIFAFYDRPVRAWLTRRLISNKAPLAPAAR